MNIKYDNGKIYKITCDENDLVYYGSTTTKLNHRLANHKINYKRFVEGKRNNMTSFDIVKYNSCKIELVEKYPCSNKYELAKRERYYIENNVCCNKQIPGRTRKEYLKIYRSKPENIQRINIVNKKSKDKNKEKNKPIKKIRDKIYYEKNKEQILEKQKTEKYTCDCGSIVRKCAKAEHNKSDKHKYFVEHGKPYEIIINPVITCECGATIKKYELTRHMKTKKHQNYINKE